MLAHREHSVSELATKLYTYSDQTEVVNDLVSNLVQDDYISDKRFCEMLCRSRFNKGIGPIRLRHELNQHEIDSNLIETYLAQYEDKWVDRLIEIRNRKYGDEKPADYKEWSRQARFLQQRGFSLEHIRLALER